MSSRIRKQIYLDRSQDSQIRKKAKTRGVSQAEIIREALASRTTGALPAQKDPSAWEREMERIRSRIGIKTKKTARHWTRDDLHER